MVIQYKLKTKTRWNKYPGKDKIVGSVKQYDFRLLNSDKSKVIVPKTNYEKVLKRFRQIEYYKRLK